MMYQILVDSDKNLSGIVNFLNQNTQITQQFFEFAQFFYDELTNKVQHQMDAAKSECPDQKTEQIIYEKILYMKEQIGSSFKQQMDIKMNNEITLIKADFTNQLYSKDQQIIQILTSTQNNKDLLNAELIEQKKMTQELQLQIWNKQKDPISKGTDLQDKIKQLIVEDSFFKYCWKVIDKSNENHASDLHLIDQQHNLFVVELKNKKNITNEDIKKSYYDISYISQSKKIYGYMFLSQDASICQFGNFNVDLEGDVPVLWLNFCQDYQLLLQTIKIFIVFCYSYQSNAFTRQLIIKNHKAIHNSIDVALKTIENVKKYNIKNIQTLENQIKDISKEFLLNHSYST